MQNFRFLQRIRPFLQNYWLHFVGKGVNRHFSTPEKLIDCQRMYFFPYNGILMGETTPKLKIGLIRLDNQTRFPIKQLSSILPWGPQSTMCLCIGWFNFRIYFFRRLMENLITSFGHKIFICMMFLCITNIDGCNSSLRQVLGFENLVGWELQNVDMHVILLEIPTHLSKTTKWPSAAKLSVDIFNCA